MDRLVCSLAALGHPQRLAVWRYLCASGGDPVAAGALSQALGIRPSTLSAYLARLCDAGLVTQHCAGTSRLYAARPGALDDLLDGVRGGAAAGARALPLRTLFVCRDGGARSRFAAAQLNRIGRPRFVAASGGVHPPRRDPLADQLLQARGHDPARLGLAAAPDLIIRLTRAPCPVPQPGPVVVHWALPDPVASGGVIAGLSRLGALYDALSFRVAALAALPVERLDDAALQRAVAEIGGPQTRAQARPA
ncbi:helix-turn-helix domain-containing protein [Aestuariicoccus sp. MJ-SS9]|uniref:helix-turn-helix domain-containing protein n=1 Tax=Aestuariicoccus sp. MJ-SS9 TaxID=3079855 RepID=UPI00290D075D|nr:helix-turn-helix domain-containing protein [Aestuariicoccus sp. MJ-SS9]MDU8913228.1 helix-turn-helix domain-containing protein [Aestuariicoccus sp. MJ-SS9]